MTKLEIFQANEGKRDILEKAMPVVLEALEALKEQLEASHVNEGVPNPDIGNSYFQQIVGAGHLIRNLPSLVKPRTSPEKLVPRRQFTEKDRPLLKKE